MLRHRFPLFLTLLALALPAGAQTLDIYRKAFQQASLAITAHEWEKCAGLFASAAEAAPYDGQAARSYFAAAACSAAKGDKETAFGYLDKAAAKGHRDVERAESNPDIEPLRQDPRWKKFLDGVKERSAAHEARLNAELTRLYEEDQKDRSLPAGQTNWSQVAQRDADRKKRVLEITGQGTLKESDDYVHAAMVFQHGTDPDDFKRAHDLCLKAVEIDPANDDARWLAAASMDRYLMYKGEPQLYGTQTKKVDGKWILWTVDPSITDEERARWDVPPLAAAKERARQMNGGG
jgi:tetratricopeptide (TPR) repeat protein